MEGGDVKNLKIPWCFFRDLQKELVHSLGRD